MHKRNRKIDNANRKKRNIDKLWRKANKKK